MARRPLTEAAVLMQLKSVSDKLAGKAGGRQRLALLRRQAELADQRDAAAENARNAEVAAAADSSARGRG